MAVIDMDGVVKVYGSGTAAVRALDEVSLQVAAGEFVALCGPSGSGKSTLLHLAGGIDVATEGRARIVGLDLGVSSPDERCRVRRQHVGYIFQRYNLIPSLTAVENVMLPLECDRMATRRARRAARRALERVGFDPAVDRFPDKLSGGEQQRVAIARAIVGEREVILADEPTGALDSATGDLVLEVLGEIASGGTAIVLVTHEPRYASLADRVVFMRDGSIVDEVTAADAPRRSDPF